MVQKSNTYNESSIKVLTGLLALRAKLSMYIGGTDSSAKFTCVRENLDNAIDEFFANRNGYLHLIVDNNVYWVVDKGQGIPVGDIDVLEPISGEVLKVSALKSILSMTHAGGKLDADSSSYEASIGTHGLGIKATNAASKSFQVWTCRDKKWYTSAYSDALESISVQPGTPPNVPEFGVPKNGTVFRIELEDSLFDEDSEVKESDIENWFSQTGAFNSLELHYTHKGVTKSYPYKGIERLTEERVSHWGGSPLDEDIEPFLLESKTTDCVFHCTDYENTRIRAFTNGLYQQDGGYHHAQVTKALSDSLQVHALKSQKFTADDLRRGIIGTINVRMASPKFASQHKDKLVDPRAQKELYAELMLAFAKYWVANKDLAKLMCERAAFHRQLIEDSLGAKAALKEMQQKAKSKSLPVKLVTSLKCTPDLRELILVEGESALGSAKKARNSAYQELLPLKGKILNAAKNSSAAILGSVEVQDILMSIGFDAASSDPLSKLRVSKVIFLTDADADGLHISSLLCALFGKYLPEMFARGLLYGVKAPEYIVYAKNEKDYWYAQTLEELEAQLPDKKLMSRVQHLKGWGEVDPEPLSRMAFVKGQRILLRLTSKDSEASKKAINDIMGEDVTFRKTLLGLN